MISKKEINWQKVEESIERSFRGVSSEKDFEIVKEAYEFDPKNYKIVSERIRELVRSTIRF